MVEAVRKKFHLDKKASQGSCSHANTRTPFLSFRLPEVLFACEHASTFLGLPAPRSLVRMRTREHLSGASGSPRSCSHANTRAPFSSFQLPEVLFACEHASPFRSFQQPEVLFACEHAGAFLELPTPQVCSHANTRAPFWSFRLPRFVRMRTRGRLSGASDSPGLFACEHATAFLELPAPRGLVRMRTREHLFLGSTEQDDLVLFACEHATTFRRDKT